MSIKEREFPLICYQLAEFIIEYRSNSIGGAVTPDVEPKFLRDTLSKNLPTRPSIFAVLLGDFRENIVRGLVSWNHPQFYAYVPQTACYAAILAEMVCSGLPSLGTTFSSSPALTEMEIFYLDLFGRLINMPSYLLYKESNKVGGGIMHHSAADAVYHAMLVARNTKLSKVKEDLVADTHKKLVVYCSGQSDERVVRAAKLLMLELHIVKKKDCNGAIGNEFKTLIENDKTQGKIPLMIVANFGSMGLGVIDDIRSIGSLRDKHNVYVHVDASYAGPVLMLPEFNKFQFKDADVDSVNVNPQNLLKTGIDGSVLFMRNRSLYRKVFKVDYLFERELVHNNEDLCDLGLPHTRRNRALRLFFVLRLQGKDQLFYDMRQHIKWGKAFEAAIKKTNIFEVVNVVHFGIVCFRRKGLSPTDADDFHTKLVNKLNKTKNIYLSNTKFAGRIVIRVCICSDVVDASSIDKGVKMIVDADKEIDDRHVRVDYPKGNHDDEDARVAGHIFGDNDNESSDNDKEYSELQANDYDHN